MVTRKHDFVFLFFYCYNRLKKEYDFIYGTFFIFLQEITILRLKVSTFKIF